MKIVCIGGGPAGLYFAILFKKAAPEAEIQVLERNRSDDTFGWGLVFSEMTLRNFENADPETYNELTASSRYWVDLATHYGGTCTLSTGHGFAALGRRKFLHILQNRARELGVEIRFECEVASMETLREADLVLGSDGIKSFVRQELSEHFRPHLDWHRCRFAWFGADKPLDCHTFIFQESEYGLFQVHAYPFEAARSSWIVECHEDVWRRAGLDGASEAESVAFCQELFAEQLGGHRILSDRSSWRAFPTVKCETWHHDNVVLVGDAAHTTHFSIGSGTKLALEDAISLVEAFKTHGSHDLSKVFAAYEQSRRGPVERLQEAARASLEWFESSARYLGQPPIQFSFNLVTRSKLVTYDKLKRRDPELVAGLDRWYRQATGGASRPRQPAPPPLLAPMKLRGLELKNRIVVTGVKPQAAEGGLRGTHQVDLEDGRESAGLVITEMARVLPESLFAAGDGGMYKSELVVTWKRFVASSNRFHTRIGLQLGHPAEPSVTTTAALSVRERRWMDGIVAAFVRTVGWAEEAGFDLIELHMADGCLLSRFLSPLTNRRKDDFGGSLGARARFPLDVFRAMREAWPQERPLLARLSADDWTEDGGGATPEQAVEVSRMLKAAGCDAISVAAGGRRRDPVPGDSPSYLALAETIRHAAEIPVLTVGNLTGSDEANTALGAGRADLVTLPRVCSYNKPAHLTPSESLELLPLDRNTC